MRSLKVGKLKSFLLVIGCLVLHACIQSPSCFDEEIFCAGLVTDTLGINDYGINQDAWVGLQISQANGITNQIAYIESVDTRDYQKNIDYFAQKGFDVIITSGIGLLDETLHSSDLYPDSVFVGLNQPFEESRANLIAITFPEDQMGFVAGALAARISKTGMIAGVCETSGIDSMWRYCEGFRAGALFVNQEIKVLVLYRDSGDREKLFIDETWGYENAISLIKRGADVVFAAGGVTGQGALRAASESNLYAIGTERNQAQALGENGKGVVTSVYGASSFEIQEVMRFVKEGLIQPVRIGQIQFVPLSPKFPQELTIGLDFLITSLWNKEIYTNVSSEKP
ncbi:MAG: BMP family ABC transporter substrate-binding protein [Anaerolineales bacterium]|nr:BMP family ABC transporter substrate-binding protein [Anaerolineales bacterium]